MDMSFVDMDFLEGQFKTIYNMTPEARREYMKTITDSKYKESYYKYSDRERCRLNRLKKKGATPIKPVELIELAELTEKPTETFKDVADKYLKKKFQKSKEPNKTSTPQPVPKELNEVIETPDAFIKTPDVPQEQPPYIPENRGRLVQVENGFKSSIGRPGDTVFKYEEVLYADTVIAKSYIVDNNTALGRDTTVAEIQEIKDYNMKIPVSMMKDIYINTLNNPSTSLRCDGEFVYLFFPQTPPIKLI